MSDRNNSQKYSSGNDSLHQRHAKYIKSIVFGGLDGIVTTFVVVAGAAGASLSVPTVLAIGLGSMIGDAFSMGIGDYAGSKSEREVYEAERIRHHEMFKNDFDREKAKIIQVYLDKGLKKPDAESIAEIIMKHERTAVDVMMMNEHGIIEQEDDAHIKGMYTFSSFIFFGFVPLFTYVVLPLIPALDEYKFIATCLLTGITLFVLGAMKVKLTEGNWFISGLQMLGIGSISATIAYLIGLAFEGLIK